MPGPGAGAEARAALRRHKSAHPQDTMVYGDAGKVIVEDWTVERLDGFVLATAASIHDGLRQAEAIYAESGETVRVVHLVERLAAQVGGK